MKPHEECVVQEKKELDERIEKLGSFLDSKTFEALPEDEQVRLVAQFIVMKSYSTILEDRIEHFGS